MFLSRSGQGARLGRVCLLALSLLGTACNFGDEAPTRGRLEASRHALARLQIGSQSRLVLRDLTRTFPVTIPPDAILEFGFGLAVRSRAQIKEIGLSVTWTTWKGKRILWRNSLGARDNGWNEFELPLDQLANETGKLGLEARVAGSTVKGLGWTNPWISSPRTHGRTNVVLISIDTLRPDRLHCYGYGRETSPNIDRFARQGILFRQAIAPSSWTLPSHASLFTGLNPSCHGSVEFGIGTPLADSFVTLAELLWQEGYATAGFTDGGFVSAMLGMDQGFDRFRENRHGEVKEERLFQQNVDLAIAWMEEHEDEPFFLFLHTYRTHMPYAPPPPYDSMFAPELTRGRGREFSLDDYRPFQANDNIPPRMLRRIEALYDGEIRYMDEVLGGVFDFLDRSGLAEDTCVVFTSDHGEEFKEHGNMFHHHAKLYEELIRVPLIIRCPTAFQGDRVVDEPVALIDVMPTLLESVGAPRPRYIQGRSLYPNLRDGVPLPARQIIGEVDASIEKSEGFAAFLRTQNVKLLIAEPSGRKELFNLQADPRERIDLGRKRRDFVEKLGQQLGQLRASCPHSAPSPAPTAAADPALRERLRALGYDQ